MKRLLPSSLLGQVMLVLAIGLLVAQTVSAVLLYRASEQRRETALVSSIAFRLIAETARPARSERRIAPRRPGAMRQREPGPEGARPFRRPMRLGIQSSEATPIGANEPRLKRYETALRDGLLQQDMVVGEIAVTRRIAGDDPYARARLEQRPRLRSSDWQKRAILVASVERADQGGWLTVRLPEARSPEASLAPIILQTLIIFAVLVLLLYLVLRRITRPLAVLTERVSDFSRRPDG